MAAAPAKSSFSLGRVVLYTLLVFFCIYYLLPLYVMLVNSLKPLSEITAGGMMALPQDWTVAPWLSAWSSAQVGVEATGLRPYFLNSIIMVVPAVALSTIVGALNGYVLTKWTFPGATILFGLQRTEIKEKGRKKKKEKKKKRIKRNKRKKKEK